jgi:hypothetical protein
MSMGTILLYHHPARWLQRDRGRSLLWDRLLLRGGGLGLVVVILFILVLLGKL